MGQSTRDFITHTHPQGAFVFRRFSEGRPRERAERARTDGRTDGRTGGSSRTPPRARAFCVFVSSCVRWLLCPLGAGGWVVGWKTNGRRHSFWEGPTPTGEAGRWKTKEKKQERIEWKRKLEALAVCGALFAVDIIVWFPFVCKIFSSPATSPSLSIRTRRPTTNQCTTPRRRPPDD